ncbi:hypothetical protein NGM10_09690 [Halorussus salilacus]|uniref:DUF7858 family protein n=1 Tax=Halorussus salilacus TaxID=2953750 RepID=UPI0020A14306|nr:hypothetical protein [Halorussus salilacus]USZ67000.1 hypothetical protein NGM10_09690 [Halorussus salilacus]
MTLSDIADGLEVTTEQRDRGVAAVDARPGELRERLAEFADDLPCDPASAAAILEGHTAGKSVGASAREAGVAPVTASKTLHLLGCEGVSPLTPRAHEVLRDWLSADLSRTEARELTGASETEFALAAFVETHDPIPGSGGVVEGAFEDRGGATLAKRDELGETYSSVGDLL